eukprot:scaffold1951_cov186-Alexandrium_tamarense.AAC.10
MVRSRSREKRCQVFGGKGAVCGPLDQMSSPSRVNSDFNCCVFSQKRGSSKHSHRAALRQLLLLSVPCEREKCDYEALPSEPRL